MDPRLNAIYIYSRIDEMGRGRAEWQDGARRWPLA